METTASLMPSQLMVVEIQGVEERKDDLFQVNLEVSEKEFYGVDDYDQYNGQIGRDSWLPNKLHKFTLY